MHESFKRKKVDVEFCIRISIGIHRHLDEAGESGVTPGNFMCVQSTMYAVRRMCCYVYVVACSTKKSMFNAYNCVHMYSLLKCLALLRMNWTKCAALCTMEAE